MIESTNMSAHAALPLTDPSTSVRQTFQDTSTSSSEIDLESVSPTPTMRLILNAICAVAMGGLAVFAWDNGLWPLMIVCWLVGGHFMHTFALSIHDAAHGTLHPNERINEWLGALYSTMILVPLTVYRRAHVHHHASLATIDDPELYPFVVPGTSRLFRLCCAIAEILFGYIYTPLLFARFVMIDKKMTPTERNRILAEYAVITSMVVAVLTAVAITENWKLYLVGLLAPAMIGGAYQTLRKYTEHLGLFGTSILESTRSILPRDRLNTAISSLVQHVDHHGTHHIRARIPYFELPPASEQVYQTDQDRLPVYHSYASAFWAMLRTLPDPKAGAQWKSNERPLLASK